MASTVTESVTSIASPIQFASTLVHTCGRVITICTKYIHVHEHEHHFCAEKLHHHALLSQAFPIFAYLLLYYCEYKGFKNWQRFGDKGNRTINEQHFPEEKPLCKVTTKRISQRA